MGRVKHFAKKILSREYRQLCRQVEGLKALPVEDAYEKAGDMLHQLCIRKAAEFVKDAQARDESPFKDLHEHDFFHEMLIVDLWMADKVFSGKRKAVAESLHKQYERVFYLSGHADKSLDEMRRKFEMYTDTWCDITGHQDEFGLAVSKNLFGSREFKAPYTSFWIVWHADEMRKNFVEIRKLMKGLSAKH
ncbi:MAG: hypothetical protein EPN22_01740 [Nitrospirae bacterium]|nr:MAG: hypothetical protein EPN22_01740 [Nitrospirota bacterium]